eukprot:TRINITY_DN16458_c0_g1_i1.p1 TRINITY_DN16458_c0_g1~~TRINITY_DN16458_c0_g1_i1.p1  ORF type:complete len:357 (+),score=58.49 TRINITY_DN16458_c0_g1_i1:28-1071(+)
MSSTDQQKWGDIANDDDVDVFGDALPTGSFAVLACEEDVSFNDVEVTIPHYKVVKGKRSFVGYVVQVAGNTKSWQVMKRFSEFHRLHTLLMRKNDHKVLPMFPSKLKRPLESEKHLIKRRMHSLGKYLTAVWALHKNNKLEASELVEDFLKTETVVPCQDPKREASPSLTEHATDDGPLTDRGFPNNRQLSFKATPRGDEHSTDVKEGTWAPCVSVVSTPTEHLIVLEIPGVEEEGISITVMEAGIRLFGEKKIDMPTSQVTHNERCFGTFAVDFQIPECFQPYTSFGSRIHLGNLYISYSLGACEPSPTSSSSATHSEASPQHHGREEGGEDDKKDFDDDLIHKIN